MENQNSNFFTLPSLPWMLNLTVSFYVLVGVSTCSLGRGSRASHAPFSVESRVLAPEMEQQKTWRVRLDDTAGSEDAESVGVHGGGILCVIY